VASATYLLEYFFVFVGCLRETKAKFNYSGGWKQHGQFGCGSNRCQKLQKTKSWIKVFDFG